MNVSKDGVPAFLGLDASTLVRLALRDVARGRAVSIPTLRYKIVVALAGLLPKRIVATGHCSGADGGSVQSGRATSPGVARLSAVGRCVSMQHITRRVLPNTFRSGAGLFSSTGVPQNSSPHLMMGLSKVCQPDDFSEMKCRSPLMRSAPSQIEFANLPRMNL